MREYFEEGLEEGIWSITYFVGKFLTEEEVMMDRQSKVC